MYFLNNSCFVCLKNCNKNKLKTVLHKETNDKVFAYVKYTLPELAILDSENLIHICLPCRTMLRCFYIFKKKCLKNYNRCKHYLQILQEANDNQHQRHSELQVRLTNYATLRRKEQQISELNLNQENKHEEQADVETVSNEPININEESSASEDSADRELDQQLETDKNDFNSNTGPAKQEFQCVMCTEVFSDKAILDAHLINHIYNVKGMECTICYRIFSKRNRLTQHMKIHFDIREFECEVCNKQFGQQCSLRAHMKLHTGDNMHVKEEVSTAEDNEDREHYQEVVKMESASNDVQNSASNVTTEENTAVEKDISNSKSDTENKEYPCLMCSQVFTNKMEFRTHALKHISKLTGLDCSICNKKLSRQHLLRTHMKYHFGIKPFECTICHKTFVENVGLKTHMNAHLGIKKYECKVCNKKFVHNPSLHAHMKCHTGVKDFKCSICEKAFTHSTELTRHIKAHLGIKDYECSICNKTFVQTTELKKHMKNHHSS